MDPSAIPQILRELYLNQEDVANIYHHGSWVYGSNTPQSDRDLIFVTRSPAQKPIKFHEDFNYFHEFELHKLWNQYDVCIYSVENFEILLEKNYLCVVQCLFLPDEFKIKEEIDFRTTYIEKYYNPLRIKQVAVYEMSRDLDLYFMRNNPHHLMDHPTCSSRELETSPSRDNYIFKNLFHGIRYLDFTEQLLRTKSIFDFKRATYVWKEMEKIRFTSSKSSDLYPVVEYVRDKIFEYKPTFVAVPPGGIMKGIFEMQLTLSHIYQNADTFDRLRKTCENTRYKLLSNQCITSEELEVSSSYEGEYPAIIEQIESEARDYFNDVNIVRIKIKSSILHDGILRLTDDSTQDTFGQYKSMYNTCSERFYSHSRPPSRGRNPFQTRPEFSARNHLCAQVLCNGKPHHDFGKQFLWDDKTNYFQFTYEFPLNKGLKPSIKSLRRICRLLFEKRHIRLF